MKKRRRNTKGAATIVIGVLPLVLLAIQGTLVLGGSPWPASPPGQNPGAFENYSSSAEMPNDLSRESDDFWKLTGEKNGSEYYNMLSLLDPGLYGRELEGVTGAGVDHAWSITTGRPDVSIAVLDTGLQWHDAGAMTELARKCRLNEGELPPPLDAGLWDINADGLFNVDDYLGDPRLADLNGNGLYDPQDVIWTFSDGKDSDSNGYVDDICGWDFLEDDNDPWDEVDDGHGTCQARLSGAEAGNGAGTPGTCPNAMILPVRVGDSRVIDVNDFAQGVIFAVDSGAWVVQGALDGMNNTPLGQAAVDYAWSRGVAVIASAGEGQSARRDYPGAYGRAVQVNAVTSPRESQALQEGQYQDSYLLLGGQSDYGAQTMVSCPSGGDSSEAVGRTAGIAALLYSEAENKVRRTEIWRYPGMDTPLSACEIKQLLTMTADDIDVSPDSSDIDFGSLDSIIGTSNRFQSERGWDPYFGYGRVNAYQAVKAVQEGRIPPEAEITSPGWFDLVNPGQVTLDVSGRVAAVRAVSFQYTVEFGAGLHPSEGEWATVYNSESCFEPVEGVLVTLDLADVYGAIREAMQEREGERDLDEHAFTVRIRVRDDQGNWGEDRKTQFCLYDPDAYAGTPLNLGADVSASPRFADLDDDGLNELIVATGDGYIHAFNHDLSEVAGWPVHVTPLALHVGSAGFTGADLPAEAYGSVTGTPAVGDLDHDGHLEVVAGDTEGRIYAWDKDGGLMTGFPVRSNPLYSIPDRADWEAAGLLPADWFAGRLTPDRVHRLDRWNCLDKAFLTGPVLCNLDNSIDGSLEVIASCLDGHLYAWHVDGNAVKGWPVKLVDAQKVAAFDPLTHACVYHDQESVPGGNKMITAPSVADLDGDCSLEVVCGSNEFYAEACNLSSDSCGLVSSLQELEELLGDFFKTGNTRVYAVYNDGTSHGLGPDATLPPDQLPANAYLPGWPASVAAIEPTAIADLAGGTSGPAAIADVDGDKTMEVGLTAVAGPGFLLEPDGTSHLGYGADGLPLSLQCGLGGSSAESGDLPVTCSTGGGCFAAMGDYGFTYIAPTMGLGRAVDLTLPADQDRSDDQVSAWSSADGAFLPSFPLEMNDLVSCASPAAADVDGDGLQEVLAGSSLYDMRCVDFAGEETAGWPKFTGGWCAGTPALADFDGDGDRELAAGTREGWLFIWETSSAVTDPADWPEYGQDPWGTGCLDIDARRPGKITDLGAEMIMEGEEPVGLRLAWSAPGDDDLRGQALCYDVRCLDRPIDGANWAEAASLQGETLPGAAGSAEELVVDGFPLNILRNSGTWYFAVQTRDEAGNLSAISNLAGLSL